MTEPATGSESSPPEETFAQFMREWRKRQVAPSRDRFQVRIEGEFEAAHALRAYFPDGSDEPVHGHSWRVEVWLEALEPPGGLDAQGLAVDFLACRRQLDAACAYLAHGFINDLAEFREINPTTEHLCLFFYHRLARAARESGGRLVKIQVWEGPKNMASLEPGASTA